MLNDNEAEKGITIMPIYIVLCFFLNEAIYIYTFLFAFKPEFLLLNEQRGVMMSVHIL